MIHPSSVNAYRGKNGTMPLGTLYSYSAMASSADSSAKTIRDTSTCTPLMAALFGGKITNLHSNYLVMDGWLPWYVKTESQSGSTYIKVVLNFRRQLERVLSSIFEDLSHAKALVANRQPLSRAAKLQKIQSLFADGVVALLDRDVQPELSRRRSQVQQEPITPRELGVRYSREARSNSNGYAPDHYKISSEYDDDSRHERYDTPKISGSGDRYGDRGNDEGNAFRPPWRRRSRGY